MATEIYKGRKIVTRTRRGRFIREMYVTVNGVEATSTYHREGVEAWLLANVHATIDWVDSLPIDGGRFGIEWYDPKTAELCAGGLHAQEIGGTCTHPTCVESNSGPKSPCPQCGTPAGRYTPIGVPGPRLWVVAHRPEGGRKVCEASDLPEWAGTNLASWPGLFPYGQGR